MKLITCEIQQKQYIGVVRNNSVIIPTLAKNAPLKEIDSLLALLEAGDSVFKKLQNWIDTISQDAQIPLNEVKLLAPIPRPLKNIMCLGWNYADHAEESAKTFKRNAKLPEHPIVFTKSVTAINAPFADFYYDPALSTEIDWEVELGIIIGKRGRKIPVQHALDYIFGYTVINDISARDLQTRHRQFFLGKSLDGSCPMGPWIVTQDEISNPQDLDISCKVNGNIKQHSNTRHQIFDVATTISILSRGMTLEPGDIIATGTPSGVGFARTPPEFLKPGDIVECEVEHIGRIANRIVAVDT